MVYALTPIEAMEEMIAEKKLEEADSEDPKPV